MNVPSRRALWTALSVDAIILVAVAAPAGFRLRSKRFLGKWLLPVIVQGAYFTVSTALLGRTPGQMLAGLRVVDADSGRPPTWGQAALRWLVWAGPGLLARIALRMLSRRNADKTRVRLKEMEANNSEHDGPWEPAPVVISTSTKSLGKSVATILLLVIYQLTIGRTARDRVTNTRVVQASAPLR